MVDCPGAMLIKSALRDCLPASHRHPERQRRISIKAEYETNAIKYRSVGRLFYAFSLASYVMNSTPVISHLWWLSPFWCLTAPPSPRCIGRAAKGKRLYGQARRLTSPDLHILCRMCTVDNKAPYNIPFICGSKVSTCCCPTACGGEGVGEATKGGAAFPSPVRAVVKVLSKEGSYNILKEPHHPPQGGISICAHRALTTTLTAKGRVKP